MCNWILLDLDSYRKLKYLFSANVWFVPCYGQEGKGEGKNIIIDAI